MADGTSLIVYKHGSEIDFDTKEIFEIYRENIIPELTLSRMIDIIRADIFVNRKYLMALYTLFWTIIYITLTPRNQYFWQWIGIGVFLNLFFVVIPTYIWYGTLSSIDRMAPNFQRKRFQETYCNKSGSSFIIAKKDLTNEIIGFVGMRTINDEEVKTYQRHIGRSISKACELEKLVVLPEYRSKGIGSLLLSKFDEVAKTHGYCTITLRTVSSNVKNRKMYGYKNYQENFRAFSYKAIEEVMIYFSKQILK